MERGKERSDAEFVGLLLPRRVVSTFRIIWDDRSEAEGVFVACEADYGKGIVSPAGTSCSFCVGGNPLGNKTAQGKKLAHESHAAIELDAWCSACARGIGDDVQ